MATTARLPLISFHEHFLLACEGQMGLGLAQTGPCRTCTRNWSPPSPRNPSYLHPNILPLLARPGSSPPEELVVPGEFLKLFSVDFTYLALSAQALRTLSPGSFPSKWMEKKVGIDKAKHTCCADNQISCQL